jgi:hypothetical protein
MTKLYLLIEDADFGEDGRTFHVMGIFSTPELAIEEVQREHKDYSYTSYGLHDFRLYEVELDKQDAKYTYDDYRSFKFSDRQERTVCLDG